MRFLLTIKIVASNRFKRDLRLAKKRGRDISLLQTVIDHLVNGHPLDAKYRDHELSGDVSRLENANANPSIRTLNRIAGALREKTADYVCVLPYCRFKILL